MVFIGEVPFKDLPRWYKTADIFCSPATGEESFGMVLLEAMAVGTPIVASANEGYSTVVTDGKEGLMVTPRSVDELEAALKRLVEDEGLRHEMGRNGIESAKKYDWPEVAKRLLAYYDELTLPRAISTLQLPARVSSWPSIPVSNPTLPVWHLPAVSISRLTLLSMT